jgi:hypothetical protein
MANPTGKGGWQAGQSGNPRGRPPKARALTAVLERAGAKTVTITQADGSERKLSGRRFIAQALWELATTGKVTLPSGASWTVEPQDWIETVKWLYAHIDGPAKQAMELSGADGGAVQVIFRVVYGDGKDGDDSGKQPHD